MSYGINCSLCDLLCDSDGMFSVQSGRRFGRVFFCKLGCLENGLRSLKKFVEEVSSGTLHERCKIDIKFYCQNLFFYPQQPPTSSSGTFHSYPNRNLKLRNIKNENPIRATQLKAELIHPVRHVFNLPSKQFINQITED